jgi:hypothetical protein
MQNCIDNICYREDGLHDVELYQICHNIYHQEKLSKDQIIRICFTDDETKFNIIILMNYFFKNPEGVARPSHNR